MGFPKMYILETLDLQQTLSGENYDYSDHLIKFHHPL